MIELQNSDIIRRVFQSLIKVTKLKTSEDYAIYLLKTLKERLQVDYTCFKFIDFDETSCNIENLRFHDDINMVKPEDVGQGLQNLIDILHRDLSKKAGFYLIREFRDALGEQYHVALKEIGVDLRLTELQDELGDWAIEDYRLKDDKNSNIAYIEKKTG